MSLASLVNDVREDERRREAVAEGQWQTARQILEELEKGIEKLNNECKKDKEFEAQAIFVEGYQFAFTELYEEIIKKLKSKYLKGGG